jgi:hypothetical protein
MRGERPELFREPSRTLDPRDILGVEGNLPVFRQSDRAAKT